MPKSAKSRAKKLFTATQKTDEQFLKTKERAQRERAERAARLRTLRLAKEAAEKANAEKAAAKNE